LSNRFGKRQTVEVPEGISLSDSLQDAGSKAPEGWYAIKGKGQSSPAARVATKDRVKYLYYRLVAAVRGENVPVPNPPREVDLISNLEFCASRSGTTYLLAKEFMPQGWTNTADSEYWLCFVYGGTNNARSFTKWVAANEEGIVKHGIQIWRKRHPPSIGPVHERFVTNQCAIVRDASRIVKIVPLGMLRAYSDAGLLNLPLHERPGTIWDVQRTGAANRSQPFSPETNRTSGAAGPRR